jgi:hypothetical protein
MTCDGRADRGRFWLADTAEPPRHLRRDRRARDDGDRDERERGVHRAVHALRRRGLALLRSSSSSRAPGCGGRCDAHATQSRSRGHRGGPLDLGLPPASPSRRGSTRSGSRWLVVLGALVAARAASRRPSPASATALVSALPIARPARCAGSCAGLARCPGAADRVRPRPPPARGAHARGRAAGARPRLRHRRLPLDARARPRPEPPRAREDLDQRPRRRDGGRPRRLVAFAGSASIKVPLTQDRAFFRLALDRLDPSPRRGAAR